MFRKVFFKKNAHEDVQKSLKMVLLV